jgi:hypothetical protein
MEESYLYESFAADRGAFDSEFTSYINAKRRDHWKVKQCSFCHQDDGKTWASCLFKRKE